MNRAPLLAQLDQFGGRLGDQVLADMLNSALNRVMIGALLEVILEPAKDGMTMICVML